MIPKIYTIELQDDYILQAIYEDGKKMLYDVKDDIANTPYFDELENIPGLFWCAQLDESRTCVIWSDRIDLPSDIIYEYGIDLGDSECVQMPE